MPERLRRAAARVRLPLDTWERHAIAARLLGRPETLLDVGGRPGELAAFLPATRVVAANVERPADVLLAGDALPFGDRSFETAASLDVLEHLEREQRRAHLRELTRVASRCVVLCTPLGSPEHAAVESELERWYVEQTGRTHRFLREHAERGLAGQEELRELARGLGFAFELLFHGDVRRTAADFRGQVLARKGDPRAVVSYPLARFARRPDLECSHESHPWTNRAFLRGVRTA